MLIPFDRKIDWSRPPVVTLLLVLINIIMFFGWQSDDNDRIEAALDYYLESGLAEQESAAYQKYLIHLGQTLPEVYEIRKKNSGSPEAFLIAWTRWSFANNDFLLTVHNEQLILPGFPGYSEWRSKRTHFNELVSKIVFWQHGLKTTEFRPLELFTSMFLHADFLHLFGNMFFLFAVGFLVERTLGSGAYLICYLLAGLGGASFDFIFTPDRLIPGIGASGAVSGLMGMYAVLFWTRRIRFFYFLFVIFGFTTLPAIVLLPLWIGEQLYYLFAYTESNVNYLAHLGGLSFGGLIGLIARHYVPSFSLWHFEREDQEERFEKQLEEAIAQCERMEYRKGQPILARLYAQHPEDERILYYLHQCSRLNPAQEEYHRLSHTILSLPNYDTKTNQWVTTTFHDYLKRAKPKPVLNKGLMMELAERFIAVEQLKDAEWLVQHLMKKGGDAQGLKLAAVLGEKLLQAGDSARGHKYLALAKQLQS
jgi:membrane associated rhomboid family serine protease